MGKISVAISQMASENDWTRNCDKAEALTRAAVKQGLFRHRAACEVLGRGTGA
jgi:hypothetical protein